MARNGETVAAFEKAFADYVGARYAIALCNGTATLHTALVALGVKPGDRVAMPPLTMSATTIAVLHAGATPVFCDVDPHSWILNGYDVGALGSSPTAIMVSLYGLNAPAPFYRTIDDAAQTLREQNPAARFTSYSFQASKILPLGEGGMLVTDDEELATRAREFSSLGYRMRADQPRIDPAQIKSPDYARHYTLGWNYRMNDLTAQAGLLMLEDADRLKAERRECAAMYAEAIEGCEWLTPQHVPEGWEHDYWAYAVKIEDSAPYALLSSVTGTTTAMTFSHLAHKIEKHGGERPYGCWRITYREPAFRHLAPDGICPVAEDLQPRLMQMQTNNIESARKNANALKAAIREIG